MPVRTSAPSSAARASTPASARASAQAALVPLAVALLASGVPPAAGAARAQEAAPAPAATPSPPATAAAPEQDAIFTIALAGRVHWDVARFEDDARGAGNRDASELRAAWLDVSGQAYGIDYKFEADLSGGEVTARDAYLAHRFALGAGTTGTLTVGQFKQYLTLEDRVSGNHTLLVERSFLAQALAPGYRLGLGALVAGDGYTLAASGYRLETIDARQPRGRAVAVRGTWAPRRAEGDVLHLGASAAHETHDGPGAGGAPALRVQSRPVGAYGDASRTTLLAFDAGRDTDVDKLVLELAGVRGAWSWQGELGGARYDDGVDVGHLATGYAQLAWMLTGERRPYDAKSGRFNRIQPAGRAGAWELALRYDTVRGRQRAHAGPWRGDAAVSAWSAGVNWYPRPHVRVMLDRVDSRSRDRQAARTLDRTDAWLARVQLDF